MELCSPRPPSPAALGSSSCPALRSPQPPRSLPVRLSASLCSRRASVKPCALPCLHWGALVVGCLHLVSLQPAGRLATWGRPLAPRIVSRVMRRLVSDVSSIRDHVYGSYTPGSRPQLVSHKPVPQAVPATLSWGHTLDLVITRASASGTGLLTPP